VELEDAHVFLVPDEEGVEPPRRLVERDREDARHPRVEGAGVPRALRAREVARPRAHLVGRRALRLVRDEDAAPEQVVPHAFAHAVAPSRIRFTIASGTRFAESISR